MEQIAQLLPEWIKDYVLIAPFVFTILFCITLGNILHRWPRFKSDQIPGLLAPVGAIAYVVLCWKMNQDYRSSMWPQNAVIGFAVGFSSTGIHQWIENSPMLSKFPILKLLVPAPAVETKPTEEPKP